MFRAREHTRVYSLRTAAWALHLIVWAFLLNCTCCSEGKTPVTASDTFRNSMIEAAPTQEYGFYVVEGAVPEKVEELTGATLFVCGPVERQKELEVIVASAAGTGPPVFQSLRQFFINNNLVQGQMSFNEEITVTPRDGLQIKIPSQKSAYGQDKPPQELMEQCVEEMRKTPKSVLLASRDTGLPDGLVEIVFR